MNLFVRLASIAFVAFPSMKFISDPVAPIEIAELPKFEHCIKDDWFELRNLLIQNPALISEINNITIATTPSWNAAILSVSDEFSKRVKVNVTREYPGMR